MFDTMKITKIVASLCGALLILLLGKWVAEILFFPSGHGGDHAQGYKIETGADDQAAAADEGPSLFELMAAADVAKGEKVFGKCKACHKLEDGANAVGPFLYGVVGRDTDAAEGYANYSGKISAVAAVWTPQVLSDFLENPKGYAPGTTMGFSGLKKPKDRANLIAFLDQLDGDTYEMEAPATEAPAEEPAEEAAVEQEPAAEEVAAVEEPAAEEPAAEEPAAEEPAAEEAPAEEVAAEEAPAEEPAAAAGGEATGFAALVAAADQGKGAKVFNKCKACHKLEDGKNGLGPHLANLVDRPVASVDGFNYSDAMKGIGGNWTIDQLNAWLENPKEFAPGNRMSFRGVRKEKDRAALIAYLQAN